MAADKVKVVTGIEESKMDYIFNPLNNKTPQGPSRTGGDVVYTLKVKQHTGAENVFFVLTDDADKSKKEIKMPVVGRENDYYIYQVTINYKNAGLYWYYFKVTKQKYKWYLCKTPLFEVEPIGQVSASFAQLVNEKPLVPNKQMGSGVLYHIFVDRFKKPNTPAVSKPGIRLRRDWGGVLDKNTDDMLLINKEHFGGSLYGIIDKLEYIKSLGAKTIYLSPIFESTSYHKYDAADLDQIDSMFGGNAAFKNLVSEAKKHGIGIILDGVFNHVGSDSIYFKDAIKSKDSKYYDWFTFQKYPDKYSCWWGIETLPQLNGNNPAVQNFVTETIGKYMSAGILGFRLDVADELSDTYLDKICARIRQVKPDALVLGEVWEDAATKIAYEKRRFYFNGKQLNSVMNYPLKNAIIDFVVNGNADGLASTLFMLRDHYPKEVVQNLMNFLGTHDTKRILTVLRESSVDLAIKRLKIASAIQYCAPGVPAVFYGDEAGVTGGDAPFCRVCFPWGKEDKEILKWYRKLGQLRAGDIFTDGDCNVLFAHNGVFIMERRKGKQRVILAANCAREDFRLNIDSPLADFETGKAVKDSLLLKPYDFVILTSVS